jgi:hypothetical protein
VNVDIVEKKKEKKTESSEKKTYGLVAGIFVKSFKLI